MVAQIKLLARSHSRSKNNEALFLVSFLLPIYLLFALVTTQDNMLSF
jgi:hypothetical protein